ncbi:MAG: hypothetical protein ACR2H5_10815, partial [Ktedonobacteraceae bacterium]
VAPTLSAQPFPAGSGSVSRVVYSRGDPCGRPGGELNRLSTLKLTPKSDAPCGRQGGFRVPWGGAAW